MITGDRAANEDDDDDDDDNDKSIGQSFSLP